MGFYTSSGFLKLLSRFRKDQSPEEEKEAMDIWYESLGDAAATDSTRNQENVEKVWAGVIERIGIDNERSGRSSATSASRYWYYLTAATVLLVSGLTAYLLLHEKPLSSPLAIASLFDHPTTFENNTDAVQEVTLPDGSKVILDPSAQLSYSDDFNSSSRTVQLVGNAFFSVVKNKRLPFIVQTDVISTRVLGTEFTIKKNKASGETEVEVLTGKVEVNVTEASKQPGKTKNQRVFLTANLKATFQPLRNELITGLVSSPKIVAQNKEEAAKPVIFNDEPLSSVLRTLENLYGVSITVADDKILQCPITADLTGEALTTQLEMVVTALNSRFSVNQEGILIEGGGCAKTVSKFRNSTIP